MQPLQVERAPGERRRTSASSSDEQQARAPRRQLQRGAAGCAARLMAGAPLPAGGTTCTRRGGGTRMPSCLRGDLLDARVHRPGALLELQLAPLDLELLGELLLLLQLDVELARLVLRGDERERAGDQDGEQDQIQPRHHASRGSRQSVLRDAHHGAARARIGRDLGGGGPLRLPDQLELRLRQLARRAPAAARGSRSAATRSRRKRLTMRSSSEWKLITTSRPPGAQELHALRQR